jgi:hypothetical protein
MFSPLNFKSFLPTLKMFIFEKISKLGLILISHVLIQYFDFLFKLELSLPHC